MLANQAPHDISRDDFSLRTQVYSNHLGFSHSALDSNHNKVPCFPLSELLLDEERPKVRKLPSARGTKNNELDEDPADNTAIGRLGLISEFGFTLLDGTSVPLHVLTCISALTLWNTCSLRMSLNLALRSFRRDVRSSSLVLSELSISLVSPMTRSRFILMPPLGFVVESQEERPELEDGVKQILWSPDSAAEKVNRPDDEPRWETTR